MAKWFFPILVPIPFGVQIKATVFDVTLINKIRKISVEHVLWAKFVCNTLEQNENGCKTSNIAKILIGLWSSKKAGNPYHAASKDIQDTNVPITAPFMETSSATKKHPASRLSFMPFSKKTPPWQVRLSTLMMMTMMTMGTHPKSHLSALLLSNFGTLW